MKLMLNKNQFDIWDKNFNKDYRTEYRSNDYFWYNQKLYGFSDNFMVITITDYKMFDKHKKLAYQILGK